MNYTLIVFHVLLVFFFGANAHAQKNIQLKNRMAKNPVERILFKGIPNHMEVTGVKEKDFTLTARYCSVKKDTINTNTFSVFVPSDKTILYDTLFVKSKNKTLKKIVYSVIKFDPPLIAIGNCTHLDTRVNLDSLKARPDIRLILPEESKLSCDFEFVSGLFSLSKDGNQVTYTNHGTKLQENGIRLINSAKKGDVLMISGIRLTVCGLQMRTGSLAVIIE